jgi:hypothetical protein
MSFQLKQLAQRHAADQIDDSMKVSIRSAASASLSAAWHSFWSGSLPCCAGAAEREITDPFGVIAGKCPLAPAPESDLLRAKAPVDQEAQNEGSRARLAPWAKDSPSVAAG